ncbi:MAG TPA: F0F1 ATP synthase subunit B' [Rhodospirillales bacterium]|jgi:F-type H+-transporting ATPase subunit b|nr:F0F1 ATP synthase subunit B' [Rhodospirillales bacterium]|tara:strand:- start:440 stop:931 length:492 start_codon:yes stop_codon:yes gene_type:complete
MPQFDPTMFTTQLVWLAITFSILFLLMKKVALPRISQVLNERKYKNEENLEKAEQLKNEAEAAAKAYENTMAEARDKARDVVREVQEHMAKEGEMRHQELAERLTAEIKTTEARIAAAKDKAIAGISGMASEVAAAAVKKLVEKTVDEKTVKAAIAITLKGPQ